MARTRNDEGTVRQNKSGTWRVVYTNPEGQRVGGGTFATEKEAWARLRAILTDMGRGDYFDDRKGNTLFSTVAHEALKHKSTDWSLGTLKNNESHLRNALLPFMGKPIKAITIETVDKWWSSMPPSQNRRNAYFLLTTIMRLAVRWKYIRATPCDIDKAGRDESKPRPRFTIEQFKSVVGLMPETMQAAMWVAFSGHLRLGEIVGLNRGDYDPSTGRLTVERQISTVGGTHEAPTKTRVVTTITLLKPGQEALKAYLSTRPMLPSAPLFTGVKGGRLARGVLRSAWNKAREEAGLPEVHLHDTKRISLTFVAKTGASLEDLKKRGRHTSAAIVARYQDASDERDAELAAKADLLLDGSGI